MIQTLGQADRIGQRHQHDLAAHRAGSLGRFEQRAQVMRHQHARQFFRMQAGLQVDLGAATAGAEMKTGQRLVAAQAAGEQGMVDALHEDQGLRWNPIVSVLA